MPSHARPRALRTGSSDRGTPLTTEPGPSCWRAWRSRVCADMGHRSVTKPLPWPDTAEGDTLTYRYRPAVPDDAPRCVAVRGQTRENAFSVDQLKAIGVTVDSWRAGIADGSLPGHVCLFDGGRDGARDGGAGGETGGDPGGKVIGYCFGAPSSGEVVVLALLPEHENRGIGKKLLDTLVSDFKALGHQRLFLGCSANPAVRSYGFYRHQGWRSTGTVDAANDEVLELLLT